MNYSELLTLQDGATDYALETVMSNIVYDDYNDYTAATEARMSKTIANMNHEDFRKVEDVKDLKDMMKLEDTERTLSKALSKMGLVVSAATAGNALMSAMKGEGNMPETAISTALSLGALIISRVSAMREKSISEDQLKSIELLKQKVAASKDFVEARMTQPQYKDNKQAHAYFKKLDKLYDQLNKMTQKMETRQRKSRKPSEEGRYGMKQAKNKHAADQNMREF